MSTETSPPFAVSRDTRVKLPLALLWAMLVTAAGTGGYVYTLRGDVETHTREIRTLQEEAKASRELLVRIDENVKALKERR